MATKKKAAKAKKMKRPPGKLFAVYDPNTGAEHEVPPSTTRKQALTRCASVQLRGGNAEVAGPYVLAERARQK